MLAAMRVIPKLQYVQVMSSPPIRGREIITKRRTGPDYFLFSSYGSGSGHSVLPYVYEKLRSGAFNLAFQATALSDPAEALQDIETQSICQTTVSFYMFAGPLPPGKIYVATTSEEENIQRARNPYN